MNSYMYSSCKTKLKMRIGKSRANRMTLHSLLITWPRSQVRLFIFSLAAYTKVCYQRGEPRISCTRGQYWPVELYAQHRMHMVFWSMSSFFKPWSKRKWLHKFWTRDSAIALLTTTCVPLYAKKTTKIWTWGNVITITTTTPLNKTRDRSSWWQLVKWMGQNNIALFYNLS